MKLVMLLKMQPPMVQSHQLVAHRIQRVSSGVFMRLAALTGQGQIIQVVAPAAAHRNNMLNGELLGRVGRLT
jgi:hypothetical protein